MSVASAVLAALRAVDATIPVGDGQAPAGTRYAVLWAGDGLITAEDLGLTHDLLTLDFRLTCVGESSPEARWVSRRLRDGIVGRYLTVAGWSLGPVYHDGNDGLARDDDRPDVPVFYVLDRYHLQATRA